jgi:hypothetical protein
MVARQRELRLQARLIQPGLLAEMKGGRGQERRRRQSPQCRGGRQQHDVQVTLQHAPQRAEPV